MSKKAELTEEEYRSLDKLRNHEDAVIARDMLRENTPPYPIEAEFALSRVLYRDPHVTHTRTYTDGKRFVIIDRYSSCEARNGRASHVQSQVRVNFCMLCNKALSEY